MRKILQSAGAFALLAAVAATTVGSGIPAAAAEPTPHAQQSGAPLTADRGVDTISTTAVADADYLIFRYQQSAGSAPTNKQVFQPFQATTTSTIGAGNYYEVGETNTFAQGAKLAQSWVSKVDFSGYNTKGQSFPIYQRGSSSSCLNHTDAFNGAIRFGTCSTNSFWRISAQGWLVSSTNSTFTAGVFADGRDGTYLAMTNSANNRHPLANFHAAAAFSGVAQDIDVTSQSWKGDDLTLSGTSEPNTIVRYNGQQTTVDSAGRWTMLIAAVPADTTSITLVQVIAGDQLRTATVSLEPRQAALTASAAAGAVNTDDVTISGTGQTGATVTVKDPAGATLATTTVDAAGKYAAQVAAPNRAGTQTFTVTQTVGGTAAGSVETTFDYGTGVTVTSPVNDFIHPGGLLDFAGKGQPGGTVTIREEGKQGVIASGTVLVDGTWAITGVNLDALEHKLVISQLSTGNNTTTTTLTLSPGASPVIVPPTVVSPATGSTVDVSRPTFTGTGEPGATLTIGYGTNLIGTTTVTTAGQWTLYPTAGLALGRSDLTVTQTAGTDVTTLDYVITRVVTEPPFRVTSHTNNQTYAVGDTTFRGTSATGATIRAVNQWGTVMGTTTADANGNWAFTRYLGPTTGGYDITFSATKAGKVETQTLHLTYQGALAFAVTSPTNNSTYKTGDTTFVGKASPNTTIKAVNQWGTVMGTTTSNLEGNWSFVRYLGPTSTGYDITFTATKGTDTQRTVLHLNPELVNVPVSVTSIKDGDTYLPGENILKGKGTPGATVSAVNATNGWNVPMGSAKVDSTGNWALPSRNWGPANDYQIKVTQTNPDKSTSTVTVNVKAPRFAALTVDGVTIGGQVGPGVVATFVGKATPGSSIAVKSGLTGSTYQTVTTGITGTWSALRAWDPTHTYNLVFEQTAPDGTIDTVNYGAFTTAK